MQFMKQSFQILSTRLMDRLLETNSFRPRRKSGSKPCAQTPKQLHPVTDPERPGLISSSLSDRLAIDHPKLLHLINFLSVSGCRITEALSITANQLTSTGLVKIKALKGSNSRMVSAGMATAFIIDCKARNVAPWEGWSRWFVYRQLKKFGIVMQCQNGKRSKVTHAFRHQVAQSIKSAGMTIDDSKNALGHKSIKSTEYYHGKEANRK